MDSFAINLLNWNERVALHAASEDYGLARFRSDPTHLSGVVRFDRERLGSIEGQRVAHLQCHIGTDTVSLARLGAAHVTGLDFSPPAVEVARQFALDLEVPVDIVEADVYSAPEALGRGIFDLVYTGIGALCWLPDIDRWAKVVSELLAPGGRLFIREGHPVLWSLDYEVSDRLVIGHPYFQTPDPIIDDEETTYVDTVVRLQNTVTHSWNHGLGEVITSLMEHGLNLTGLVEHMSVPWAALPEQMTPAAGGEWVLTDRPARLPLTYTLQAIKP
ncbi:MAG: class I SAM-dependent methyltransferase [Candidatus Nanopelagicales bacterium]